MNRQSAPTIVATQGYPYTGKTTIANALAKRLRFSSLRLDDILDFVVPLGEPQEIEPLKSRAFDLLIHTVKTQISLGLSVILDSDLSRRSHLHKLTALQTLAVRIVIVECNPKTLYTWEMRFNKRDSTYNSKWYKPQNQQIDPEFKRDYTDKDLDVYAKLIVNTTNYVDYDLVASAVLDLTTSTRNTTDSGPWIIHLENWRRQHNSFRPPLADLTRQTESNKMNKHFCTDGRHCLNKYNQQGIDYYATCAVCEKVMKKGVDAAAYTCSLCPLAIHKSCAEAGDKTLLPDNFPKFLNINSGKPKYCFPEEHLCLRCIVDGNNEFTYECEGCVFQCHLKCGLLPTILYHEGHGGPLFFSTSNENKYMCAACKCLGSCAAYGCVEDCNINYHPECAMLPLIIEHQHGGYDHGLRLIFCREEELEDYFCHLCFQELNPDAWYYYCKCCGLELHLHCAFEEL